MSFARLDTGLLKNVLDLGGRAASRSYAWWRLAFPVETRPLGGGRSHGRASRGAHDRRIAGTGFRLAGRPGQPDRLSFGSQGRLGEGLVGPRRGRAAGGDRGWRVVPRGDHSLRRAPELLLPDPPLVPALRSRGRHTH